MAVVYYKYSIHYGCRDERLLLRAGVLAPICHSLVFVISQNPLYCKPPTPFFFFTDPGIKAFGNFRKSSGPLKGEDLIEGGFSAVEKTEGLRVWIP